MIVKLLTEHHLEFLSLKGGCKGSSESTLVKISNCWKSHAAAHIISVLCNGTCSLMLSFLHCSKGYILPYMYNFLDQTVQYGSTVAQ